MGHINNLAEFKSIEIHWIALFVNSNNIIYFDSFGVEHIPKEIKQFSGNKNIISNIYRIQACDLIRCGQFCLGFIDFVLKGLDYTNSFSPMEYEKIIK